MQPAAGWERERMNGNDSQIPEERPAGAWHYAACSLACLVAVLLTDPRCGVRHGGHTESFTAVLNGLVLGFGMFLAASLCFRSRRWKLAGSAALLATDGLLVWFWAGANIGRSLPYDLRDLVQTVFVP